MVLFQTGSRPISWSRQVKRPTAMMQGPLRVNWHDWLRYGPNLLEKAAKRIFQKGIKVWLMMPVERRSQRSGNSCRWRTREEEGTALDILYRASKSSDDASKAAVSMVASATGTIKARAVGNSGSLVVNHELNQTALAPVYLNYEGNQSHVGWIRLEQIPGEGGLLMRLRWWYEGAEQTD